MRLKPITEDYFRIKQLFEESLETKSVQDKYKEYLEIDKRYEQAYKDYISILNSQNPFAYLIGDNHKDLHEVYLMYKTFNKVRNSILSSSEKVQKNFEKYLLEAEELISEIRNLSESLADTGMELETINEGKAKDIIALIKKEIVNFKKWIQKKVKKLKQIHAILKQDIEFIEKEIQKEFTMK